MTMHPSEFDWSIIIAKILGYVFGVAVFILLPIYGLYRLFRTEPEEKAKKREAEVAEIVTEILSQEPIVAELVPDDKPKNLVYQATWMK
jgi:hypothetical protein